MQVYSQVGLLEGPYFYQPSMGLETIQGGGKPRPYHIRIVLPSQPSRRGACPNPIPDAPGRGQALPLPWFHPYPRGLAQTPSGRGQAPPLHFFVFAFDGVVAGATALVGWCILLCATKV